MPSLGYFLLLASFVVCSYAAGISVAGARRGSRRLVESGIGAFYLVTALMTVASALIIHAFVTNDYTIKYVQHYSDAVQPLFYKITSYWGGLDGSIMFWVFLLSVFGAIAIYVNRESQRELIPYVVAVISVVEMFFLFLMIVHKNPFETFLTAAPTDGRGLNPLLQNGYMVIHPPSLYTGFVGMTIPYAFGMAALITGYLDDSWLRAVRRWTMFAWIFLSFGLTLGMIWAYEELGWGGFWGWDPVENAGLLPWFTATAFLHSVMVQERRSMLRVWNVVLVITTFFLTIFGTFMTRSGVVQSVHAFGEDPVLARMFGWFMATIIVGSFGLVIYRLPLLRSRNELESWVSREAAFLVNNWILLFSAFLVLFGTMFPTISEAITGQRITVAKEFFNRWMLPVGLILLLLTGIGPLLAWRKSTVSNLRYQFLWPALTGIVTGIGVLALGLRVWTSGLCFIFSGFVLGTIVQEFWRGAVVRRRSTGTDLLTAMIGLVGRSRRRYGGYIVHVGIVLMFLGFAGQGFHLNKIAALKPGQQVTVGHFTVRHDSVKATDDGAKQMITGHVTVFEDGREIGKMYPARWFYRKHEQEPTTEVAIRRRMGEDLYIVMQTFELSDQSVNLEVHVNPLVNWIWFGFAVMAIGTGLALLPERTFAFAMAKFPAEAAATTVALFLVVLLSGTPLSAQSMMGDATNPNEVQTSFYARTPLEKQLQREIVCTCGCGHINIGECRKDPCVTSHQLRGELAALIDQNKSHDEIVQWFIAKYGSQEMLGAPVDKGFNRLAWLLPYALAGTVALAGGLVFIRRSRHGADTPLEPKSIEDAALQARLDEELQDLD
jgi:cytochrome c-type biogenesis protein CcmF